jgi:hypothetical protein
MQQEGCLSCHVFKLETQYDATVYSLETMTYLYFVIQGRPPNLTAYNNYFYYELALYFVPTHL